MEANRPLILRKFVPNADERGNKYSLVLEEVFLRFTCPLLEPGYYAKVIYYF